MPSEERTTPEKPGKEEEEEEEEKKKKKRRFLISISVTALCSRCCRYDRSSGIVNPKPLSSSSFRGFPTEGTPDYYFESARLFPLDNGASTSSSPRFGRDQLQAVDPYLRDYDALWAPVTAEVTTTVVSPCRKINNSIALATDSEDPYRDFKRSMQQMVFEKEIHSRREMRELLNCFLKLNAPSHHEAIARAYAEIRNDVVFSKRRMTRIGFVSCFS